jgi:hypothetical protein
MQYQVPQFIEIEDKPIGPFTFKQFLYLAGGAGLCFILWVYLPRYLSVPLIVPIAILAAALAFYKINNRPFILVLEAALRYALTKKLYIWRKENKQKETKEITLAGQAPLAIPRLSGSKLTDLAWSLDIQERVK